MPCRWLRLRSWACGRWRRRLWPAHRVSMDTMAALPASVARSMPEQGQSGSRRGLCPVCEQDVPLAGGRFPRHRAQSGGWFEACIVEGAREPYPLVPAGRTFTQALTDAGYRVAHYRSGDDYRLVAYAPHAPADHYLVAVWRTRRFLRALVAFPESATFHNSLAGLRRDLVV